MMLGNFGMDRRTFVGNIAGSLLAVATIARAQKPAIPVIGFLSGGSAAKFTAYVAAFREGLNAVGYVEGKNVAIEFRWAEGQFDKLPALAADLVGRQVAVIVATGGTVGAQAAKAATSTIPIVFLTGIDPVEFGLVASLGRPGGNVTGIAMVNNQLTAKRMELLHELVPNATEVAFMVNPNNRPNPKNWRADSQAERVQDAARSFDQHLHLHWHLHFLQAGTAEDIDVAFATMARLRVEALIVHTDPFFNSRREAVRRTRST